MVEFVIASNNDFKVTSLAGILAFFGASGHGYQDQLGHLNFPTEGEVSYAANARAKAEFISARLPQAWVIADDSGITLANCPGQFGVRTARDLHAKYGTPQVNARLVKLAGERRDFEMTTVISLASGGQQQAAFTGTLRGTIARQVAPVGHGLDQILIPAGLSVPLGTLPLADFVQYDHRSRAVAALLKKGMEEFNEA